MVETEDKDGADDYHEDGTQHTHPENRMKGTGDDYHNSNFTHTHGDNDNDNVI